MTVTVVILLCFISARNIQAFQGAELKIDPEGHFSNYLYVYIDDEILWSKFVICMGGEYSWKCTLNLEQGKLSNFRVTQVECATTKSAKSYPSYHCDFSKRCTRRFIFCLIYTYFITCSRTQNSLCYNISQCSSKLFTVNWRNNKEHLLHQDLDTCQLNDICAVYGTKALTTTLVPEIETTAKMVIAPSTMFEPTSVGMINSTKVIHTSKTTTPYSGDILNGSLHLNTSVNNSNQQSYTHVLIIVPVVCVSVIVIGSVFIAAICIRKNVCLNKKQTQDRINANELKITNDVSHIMNNMTPLNDNSIGYSNEAIFGLPSDPTYNGLEGDLDDTLTARCSNTYSQTSTTRDNNMFSESTPNSSTIYSNLFSKSTLNSETLQSNHGTFTDTYFVLETTEMIEYSRLGEKVVVVHNEYNCLLPESQRNESDKTETHDLFQTMVGDDHKTTKATENPISTA